MRFVRRCFGRVRGSPSVKKLWYVCLPVDNSRSVSFSFVFFTYQRRLFRFWSALLLLFDTKKGSALIRNPQHRQRLSVAATNNRPATRHNGIVVDCRAAARVQPSTVSRFIMCYLAMEAFRSGALVCGPRPVKKWRCAQLQDACLLDIL